MSKQLEVYDVSTKTSAFIEVSEAIYAEMMKVPQHGNTVVKPVYNTELHCDECGRLIAMVSESDLNGSHFSCIECVNQTKE